MTDKKTYIAILLDSSGSMAGIKTGAVAAVRSILKTIREQSHITRQETIVSVFVFADYATLLIPPTDIRCLDESQLTRFRPDGMTALFDAVGVAVEELRKQFDLLSKHSSYLVLAITDGEENRSNRYNAESIKKLMRTQELTDQWTFTFQVPHGFAQRFINNFGISKDNVREWEATERGVEEMEMVTSSGFTNYFQARASGQTATRTFYNPVTTSLADVKITDLKSLDLVSRDYKCFEVKKESPIKEFVEEHTNKPYGLGASYYLLMKPEKIQPHKAILLMEKGKKVIYGGHKTRDLIGLIQGEYAKVTPGNHSNYDIFVQSTSMNRILPRGTKLLVKV